MGEHSATTDRARWATTTKSRRIAVLRAGALFPVLADACRKDPGVVLATTDDANYILPWYHTTAEEQGAAGQCKLGALSQDVDGEPRRSAAGANR